MQGTATKPRIELLWWEGCPSYPAAHEQLRDELARVGLDPDSVELREVASEEDARREGFVGSPTIRIDGQDIDPPPPDITPALNCRIYRLADGRVSPTPDPALLRRAVAQAADRSRL